MINHILFDFDGTLVDTNEIIIKALTETVENVLHKGITREDLLAILGKYLDDQMRYFSEEKYKIMVEYYKNYYRENQDKMVKKFAGIDHMLQQLKQMGCKLGIVSAKGKNGIMHGLRLYDLEQYIDCIISAYDVVNNKPHPECVYKALKFFKCDKDQMLLIGDSPYDIQCGINAGIKTGLVSWTIFPNEQFQNVIPGYIISKPDDIISLVNKSQ